MKLKLTDRLLVLLNYQLIVIEYLILFSCLAIVVTIKNIWFGWFTLLFVTGFIVVRLLKIKTKMDKINGKK